MNELQQVDFLLTALEGEAKREIQLVLPPDRNTGKKILDFLQNLYFKPTTKAQLRANFFNCTQQPNENINAYILRLREMFFKWQEHGDVAVDDQDDMMLDQLMVGLRKGPVKQEMNWLMRR